MLYRITMIYAALAVSLVGCGPSKFHVFSNDNDRSGEIVEYIDPCGDGPGFDEVILRMGDGTLLAHYSSGGREFLTIITPGNYVTTDQQACSFTVTAEGEVI